MHPIRRITLNFIHAHSAHPTPAGSQMTCSPAVARVQAAGRGHRRTCAIPYTAHHFKLPRRCTGTPRCDEHPSASIPAPGIRMSRPATVPKQSQSNRNGSFPRSLDRLHPCSMHPLPSTHQVAHQGPSQQGSAPFSSSARTTRRCARRATVARPVARPRARNGRTVKLSCVLKLAIIFVGLAASTSTTS